jgi:hypothetical protein
MKSNPISFECSVDLTMALLDLTLYNCNDLVNVSFEFIISMYTQRSSLIASVKDVQLLEEDVQVKAFK